MPVYTSLGNIHEGYYTEYKLEGLTWHPSVSWVVNVKTLDWYFYHTWYFHFQYSVLLLQFHQYTCQTICFHQITKGSWLLQLKYYVYLLSSLPLRRMYMILCQCMRYNTQYNSNATCYTSYHKLPLQFYRCDKLHVYVWWFHQAPDNLCL